MKKFVSLALALVMLCSMIPMVHADDTHGNWGAGTTVSYVGTGTEEWTVTVPATMAPGETKEVAIEGSWSSKRQLTVGVTEATVTLVNSNKASDTKTLDVTFADQVFVGNNNERIDTTKNITVAAMPADALFGTWTGTITYTAVMSDVQ